MEIQGDKIVLSFDQTFAAMGGALKLKDFGLSEVLQDLISDYVSSEINPNYIASPQENLFEDITELSTLPYEPPLRLDADLEILFRVERALVAGKYFMRQLVRDSENELQPKPSFDDLAEQVVGPPGRPLLRVIMGGKIS